MKKIFKLLFLVMLSTSCQAQQPRITVKGTQFYKGDKPYHYIGTNYWYGALLASKDGGDRKRLAEELDLLKSNGVDNLRILVGAEAGNQDFTVTPALQPQQGRYDDNLLEGLDYLLAEMGKRGMYAVLYLNNNWEWSGGMAQYLEWNGYGKLPNPNIKPNTWPQFMEYTKQFHKCEPCIKAFNDHIKFILGRTNTYTKKKYTEDNTIMAWQVANEPRVFTADNEAAFTKWLNGVVDLLDSLAPNQLICTGSEGKAGSADDIAIFERTHDNPKIDYLTMHIWPKNWSWYDHKNEKETLQPSIVKAVAYIDEHIEVAKRLGKPIVLEEFGLPREGESLDRKSSVNARDAFYKAIFDRLALSVKNEETFAALNFWGFGGSGKNNPANGKWTKGDDFTADPPQEPQGLNTVFSSDASTLDMIKQYNKKIN
ncbi:cellulase family glycosylhydrolase [Flavobacterium sp. MFBS3-15]|uniref:glycoside hydrolase 5 family protein n=1 Tax=Flavobacterium sp. MFBS3-15 TaxID=2989816 RepID=UPI00223618D2|nr:cellulase family glycosylhydrolase [Flavobacterium sp. MFBS3-15]MCW4469054.1 cellulase family glycosylhydrolase [Flavobacterium sp. MFBS3-15]